MSKPPPGMLPTLRILGTEWEVEYVADMLEDGKGFGSCDTARRRIRIALDQHPEVMRCTLLHEAMHAILGMNGAHADDDKVHEVIGALEAGLLSLIRDNKVKW